MKRNPVIGEEVYFYHSGDPTTDPVLAKVTAVAEYTPTAVQLFFFNGTKPTRTFHYHTSDPVLDKFPSYRSLGIWDFHPLFSQLVDAMVRADVKPESKSDKKAAYSK